MAKKRNPGVRPAEPTKKPEPLLPPPDQSPPPTSPPDKSRPITKVEKTGLALALITFAVSCIPSALSSAGVVSMNVAHFTFVVAAVVIVLGFCYIEHLAARSKRRIILVAAAAALVVGVSFWVIDRWMVNKKAQLIAAEQHTMPPQTSAPPKTLHAYFLDDFKNTVSIGDEIAIKQKANGEDVIKVQGRLHQDFDSKSEFISFYIPNTPQTRGVCEYLAKEGYKLILSLGNQVGIETKTPGDSRGVNTSELKFNGGVFVYHEQPLFDAEIEALTALFRESGLKPQFRGTLYAFYQNNPPALPLRIPSP